MAVQIQLRRDTAADWTSVDPILAEGELGLEKDTGKFKFGNGVDAWSALPYWSSTTSTPSYNEIPAGAINGINAIFTLAHAPSPAGSLQLFRNGVLQNPGGNDYTLAGATITFVTAAKPQTGDSLLATYSY